MGVYTEFVLGVNLKSDTPRNVTEILAYMIDNDLFKSPKKLPDHPLFQLKQWSVMLQSDSAYFPGVSSSNLSQDIYEGAPWDLTVRCNLTNYDGEIEKFLDWISPYIETGGFLGYLRCEEFDDPTLIYFMDGKIELVEIYGPYQGLLAKRRKEDE